LNNEIFPQLDQHLHKIEESLNGIESLFGKFIFNFNEIVLLFLLVIVCGFILCINLLLDSIKFRPLFIKHHSKRDINNRILSNEEIATSSELWIEYEIKSLEWYYDVFLQAYEDKDDRVGAADSGSVFNSGIMPAFPVRSLNSPLHNLVTSLTIVLYILGELLQYL